MDDRSAMDDSDVLTPMYDPAVSSKRDSSSWW